MTIKYTKDHEWVQLEDHDAAIVGITLHAQDALGDVVFVDLPEVGKTFAQGEVAGVVESVKAAADVFMPVAGEITEVNEALRADPSLANSDPMGNGWFFKVRIKRHGAARRAAGRDRLRRSSPPKTEPPDRTTVPMPMPALPSRSANSRTPSEFIARHIGIDAGDEARMLAAIGSTTRAELIDGIVPPRHPPQRSRCACRAPVTEADALAELQGHRGEEPGAARASSARATTARTRPA